MTLRILVLALALLCHHRATAASCVTVVNASRAGHYNSISSYPFSQSFYHAGQVPFTSGSESRNWFVFDLPAFPAPLVRAELRVYAGRVAAPTGSETYELHQVTTPVSTLINYTGATADTFNDLGDGPLWGSRQFTMEDGTTEPYRNFGTLLVIPFAAEGLAALTAGQGQSFAVGGAVATLDQDTTTAESLFRGELNYIGGVPIQLLLFYSNSALPEVQLLSPPASTVAGSRVSLAGASCGQAPLFPQWLKDGTPVAGATNDTLEIPMSVSGDSGNYQLRASNAVGVALSPPVSVSVVPLFIVSEPQSRAVTESMTAAFWVGVDSKSPVTYRWRKNGTDLFGQTYQNFVLYGTSAADAGNYDVVVSNASGSVTSAVATLTVILRAPVVSAQSSRQQVAAGLPLILNPSISGSQPLSYRWLKNGTPIGGATGSAYQIPAAQFSDAGDYQVIVTNSAGTSAGTVVSVDVVAFTLDGPYYQTVLQGFPAAFTTYVQSSVPVTYQWYFNDVPLPQATNSSLRFSAAALSDAGPYFVIATNSYGARTSTVVSLTVITQAPTAYVYMPPNSSPARIGDELTLSANVVAGPPALLQWRRNGLDLSGQTNYVLFLKGVTTNDIGDYSVVAANVYGAVTSAPVHLDVIATAPVVVVTPGVSNALEGSIVALRTLALGGPPPTYQWRRNGSDLPGQTNATLLLPHATTADTGLYEIRARNDLGEISYTHSLNVSPKTGLDRWGWRRPLPQGSRLRDVTFGNGRYVAVGKSGSIITSTNGVDWTGTIVEIDGDFQSVAFGNGLFLAAGYMAAPAVVVSYYPYPISGIVILLVSSNGVDWALGQAPHPAYVPDLAFGDGVFVSSGTYGPAFNYTSTDGVHWTPHTGPSGSAYRVAWGAGKFVAATGTSLYYSGNGAHWTPASNGFFSSYVSSMTYGNGQFVATSYGASVLTSPDGIHWTERATTNYSAQGIAAGGGRFVAVLNDPVGAVMVSSDAVTWTQVDTGTAQVLESIVYAGQFVAVGEAGTITTSADGVTWTPSVAANRIDYYGLADGANLVIAAGDSGTILTTSDGRNWTQRSTPTTRNLHAAHYANGLFVVGGRRGAIITSPNGVTWTARNSGLTNYVERIQWGNGLWLAVGEHGDTCRSGNGLIWTPGTTGGPFSDNEGVAYGNEMWVVVGGFFRDRVNEIGAVTTIYVSTNGAAWTVSPFDFGVRLRDVTFAQGRFLAVGNDGLVATSTNGLSWAGYHLSRENFRRAHYANGRFVIVGNNGEMRSSPTPELLSSWVVHRSRTSLNLHDILGAADGTFFTVGNNGTILQSGDTRPRFTSIRAQDGAVVLEFDPGIAAGQLRLESTVDFTAWGTLAQPASSPLQVPLSNPASFFRLVTP